MRRGLVMLALLACTEPMVDRPPPGKDASFALDGGAAEDAAFADAGSMGCEAPRVQCGTTCVNVLTSPLHCGDCNQPCSGGSYCDDGRCVRTCPAGLEACGMACVDRGTDRDHCGMCDRACPADRACRGGSCVCPEGYTECGGVCVAPDTDPQHCGICDRRCAADEFCGGGSCQCTGGQRETACGDGMDNDCDRLVDCADPDCVGTTRPCMGRCGMGTQTCNAMGQWNACEGGNGEPEICGDGIDQDCDGRDLRRPDAWEPNDSCGAAKWISMDTDPMTTIRPSFDSVEDPEDVFKFNASDDFNFGFPERILIRLEQIPSAHDYDVFLYRNLADCTARRPLASSDQPANANEAIDWQEVFNSDDSGTFYVRVVRFRGYACTGTYSLTVNGLR